MHMPSHRYVVAVECVFTLADMRQVMALIGTGSHYAWGNIPLVITCAVRVWVAG